MVSASGEVFSYAAVIDNATTDPIFVRGAEDRAPAAAPAARTVRVGQGGFAYRDDQTQGTTTQAVVGDTVTWIWEGAGRHGVTSGRCTAGGYYDDESCDSDGVFSSGSHEGPFTYTHTFTEAGSFAYYCPVHGAAMKGRVVVSAPARPRRERGRLVFSDGLDSAASAGFSGFPATVEPRSRHRRSVTGR